MNNTKQLLEGQSIEERQRIKEVDELIIKELNKQNKLENDSEKKLRDINALSKVYNNSQKIDLKKDDLKKYTITEKNEGKKQN